MAADFSFTLPSTSKSNIQVWNGATYKSSDGEEYSVTVHSNADLFIKWKTVSSKLIKIQRYSTNGSNFSYTKTYLVPKAQSHRIPFYDLCSSSDRYSNYYDHGTIEGTFEITISPHLNFDTRTKMPEGTKHVLKEQPVMEKKLDHLSSDMKNLLNTGDLSDIVLTDGKTEIRAHKVILSLRSKVFAKILEDPKKENRTMCIEPSSLDNSPVAITHQDRVSRHRKSKIVVRNKPYIAKSSPNRNGSICKLFQEKLENRITIEDISIPVLKELLHFMYSGTILIKDTKMARDLYIASDKYAVKELKNICSEILKKVNLNTVLDILLLSDLHDDKDLKNAALNFVSQNYSEVKALKDWNDFIKANQTLSIEILSFVIDKKN